MKRYFFTTFFVLTFILLQPFSLCCTISNTPIKRMVGAELELSSITLQLVPIATALIALPFAPAIYTGIAICAAGWSIWHHHKIMQQKEQGRLERIAQQKAQVVFEQFSEDSSPDNSNVVVIGMYYPPSPEDPDNDKNIDKRAITQKAIELLRKDAIDGDKTCTRLEQ